MNELVIPLPNGGSLRCGEGELNTWGGYIRLCDAGENEILYWDVAEWEEDGESVIGAVFAAALKPLKELTAGCTLVDGVWEKS